MKNQRLQKIKGLARQFHRNHRSDQFQGGIRVRHRYNEQDQNELCWWDDVAFILGKTRIAVAWTHPRQEYQTLIHNDAHTATDHLYDDIDLFADRLVVYKRIGRSRKKITGYQAVGTERLPWFEALQAEKSRLSRVGSYTVRPSMKIKMLSWCRFVEICTPVEVRGVVELRSLANLVRRILIGNTTLNMEFPDYAYTRENWLAEKLEDQTSNIHPKAIAT